MQRLVCFAVHISLFSACFGAAVDAPKTSTGDASLNSKVSEVEGIRDHVGVSEGGLEEEHRRHPRSASQPRPVLSNFLPMNNLDFDNLDTHPSDSLSEDSIPRSLHSDSQSYLNTRQRFPVPSLSQQSWQLEPQVGKRGKRVRGESHYRRDSPEMRMLASSLDAATAGAATTMLSRQQRTGRRYDVPQIGEYCYHFAF